MGAKAKKSLPENILKRAMLPEDEHENQDDLLNLQ